MKLGTLDIQGNTWLAPMAGVTDWAFRCICQALGAAVTVTEMVSSRALVYRDKKSMSLLRKTKGGFCGAQFFGNEPSVMAEAAVICAGTVRRGLYRHQHGLPDAEDREQRRRQRAHA